MTLPFRPTAPAASAPTFDREGAKRAGYTDAEIDAYLASSGPAAPRAADPYAPAVNRSFAPRESVELGATAPKVSADQVTRNNASWVGAGRQLVQGATFGFGDELEAGARSAFGPRTYTDVRDDIRGANKVFTDENPGATLALNAIGGLATGGTARTALKAVAPKAAAAVRLPFTSMNTAGGRIANTAAGGALTGGVAGVGNSDGTLEERLEAGALTGLAGGGLGGALGAGGELFTAVSKLVRGRMASAQPAAGGASTSTAIARTSGERSAETGGIERIGALMDKTGKTVDDLRTWDATADVRDVLGEGFGPQGVSTLGSANRLGRQAPERIRTTLDERARDEGAALSANIEGLTGVAPRDPKAYADEAMAAVQPRVARLYERAYAQPPVRSARLEQVVAELSQVSGGKKALARASELSVGNNALQVIDPQNPEISVQNLHHLREGLDFAIDEAIAAGDGQMVRMLTERRVIVDRIVKKAGGAAMRTADQLFANAKAQGEAFSQGAQLVSGQNVAGRTPEGLARAVGTARAPESLREGAASEIATRIYSKGAGIGGNVQNPTADLFNAPAARARTRLGFRTDDDFAQASTLAQNVGRRLQNRTEVLYGSQTASRQQADADQLGDGVQSVMTAARSGPLAAAMQFATKGVDAARRRAIGAELDEASRYLLAGGPTAMNRTDAVNEIARRLPSIREQNVRRTVAKALISGQVGAAAMPR